MYMPLEIKEHNQDKLSVKNTANNLDQQLADMPDPLPNYSGFNMIIAGSQRFRKNHAIIFSHASQESQGY
jgi:hypothetical protein